MFKSWKTSLGGILALLTVVYKGVNDPTTIFQPETLAMVSAGVGLLSARDNNVCSEDAGAK